MRVTYFGIDVSARELIICNSSSPKVEVFENTAAGHKRLVRWLKKRRGSQRVVMEPTGLYSLDAAIALTDCKRVELAMPNPRAVRHFGHACLTRSKTDAIDAALLMAYGQQMPWVGWSAPNKVRLQLRAISRAILALGGDKAALKCRLHAVEATQSTPSIVAQELVQSITEAMERQNRLRDAAVELIKTDMELNRRYELLLTLPGIARGHAITLTAELCVLDEAMTAKQWVAFAGVDPVEHTSGKKVWRPPHISRRGNARVRHSLYMASTVAALHNDGVKRVHSALVERGKTKKQAHIAIGRKYLHVIHSMWRNNSSWDQNRFGRLT